MAGIRRWGSPGSWRAQSYVALASSFVRIFFANLNAPATAGFVTTLQDPRVLVLLPLTGIYFFVYWRTNTLGQNAQAGNVNTITQVARNLIACLGTATLAAIGWFAAPADAVATGLAALLLAVLAVAWWTKQRVFLFQAMVLLGLATFRLSMHNFFHLNDAVSSSLSNSIWPLALIGAGLPFAFLIRRDMEAGDSQGWWAVLLRRPEQPMFFVTFILVGVLLYLKMSGGTVTLSWAAEGVLAFMLALWVKERSFRLAGLALVIFCVVKIPWDTWQFHDWRRAASLIGVGVILFVISFLYGKYSDSLREYL